MKVATVLLPFVLACFAHAQDSPSKIQIETVLQTTSSWDGTPYKAYPAGQPKLSVLKITIPPRTKMKWHEHPFPNAAYILSGDLTVEKRDGTSKHFATGEAVAEMVDSAHRGVTGEAGVVLVVFYAGNSELPLSISEEK
ncbi:cupin domain-containing protein [Granulicella sp. S190]|uniref:cupin domain-containing protein n=1 Tax=Granulicella sp. S190 TaxID=1747226 RepID=UPI001C203479|nr:cupin domain-containing protein [Granulicella sp. S190]